MTILLSRKDVESILNMKDNIIIIENAFTELYNQSTIMPVRTPIAVPENNGVALFMPAYLKSMKALGTKIVTVYKDNVPKYGLPTVMGTIVILNAETGAPEAIMDGGFLTAMRTGAVSGVATKLCSRNDSKVHTIVGTGVQAKAQVWAVLEARPNLEKTLCYSIDTPEKKKAFTDELSAKHNHKFEIADSMEEAVRAADILTLATSAKDPIINGDWLKPGLHINSIGSHAPSMRELDTASVLKSKIICDSIEACKSETGDFIIPCNEGVWNWDRVYAELCEVVAKKKPGRNDNNEITLFKSNGLAIQDISTAYHVYQKALELKLGVEFSF